LRRDERGRERERERGEERANCSRFGSESFLLLSTCFFSYIAYERFSGTAVMEKERKIR
jgi:hypothetical protein